MSEQEQVAEPFDAQQLTLRNPTRGPSFLRTPNSD